MKVEIALKRVTQSSTHSDSARYLLLNLEPGSGVFGLLKALAKIGLFQRRLVGCRARNYLFGQIRRRWG